MNFHFNYTSIKEFMITKKSLYFLAKTKILLKQRIHVHLRLSQKSLFFLAKTRGHETAPEAVDTKKLLDSQRELGFIDTFC